MDCLHIYFLFLLLYEALLIYYYNDTSALSFIRNKHVESAENLTYFETITLYPSILFSYHRRGHCLRSDCS